MSRAAQNQAKQTFGQASGVAGTTGANANSIFGPLYQQYFNEATNPTGFGEPAKAKMNTAVQQSTGGSTAGAVGSGNLMAARTRNRGGFQIANNEAAREGRQRNSEAALGIENEDARLKEAQRQEGMAGESGLYGQNLNATLQALGIENGSTQALTSAGNNGWLQNSLGIMGALSQGATAAAKLGAHV